MLRDSPVRMNKCDAIRVAGKMGFGVGGATTVAEGVILVGGAADRVEGGATFGVAIDVGSGVGVSSKTAVVSAWPPT